MNVSLWISNKQYRFVTNFGWYAGEYFTLFGLTILEITEVDGMTTIFEIRIGKFLIALYLERTV